MKSAVGQRNPTHAHTQVLKLNVSVCVVLFCLRPTLDQQQMHQLQNPIKGVMSQQDLKDE